MELDTMPAKKMRGNSDMMDEYGQLYHSQWKVRTERDFVPSGFLPPSRPLDCSGIAVVNNNEHEVDRISYSPLPQQTD